MPSSAIEGGVATCRMEIWARVKKGGEEILLHSEEVEMGFSEGPDTVEIGFEYGASNIKEKFDRIIGKVTATVRADLSKGPDELVKVAKSWAPTVLETSVALARSGARAMGGRDPLPEGVAASTASTGKKRIPKKK